MPTLLWQLEYPMTGLWWISANNPNAPAHRLASTIAGAKTMACGYVPKADGHLITSVDLMSRRYACVRCMRSVVSS